MMWIWKLASSGSSSAHHGKESKAHSAIPDQVAISPREGQRYEVARRSSHRWTDTLRRHVLWRFLLGSRTLNGVGPLHREVDRRELAWL